VGYKDKDMGTTQHPSASKTINKRKIYAIKSFKLTSKFKFI